MLLQKVIHTHQSLDDTKALFAKPGSSADAISHCEFSIGHGFRARFDLVLLPSDDSNQLLFRSESGNVRIAGLVEFLPVRDHLTEVQLTLDCTIMHPIHRLLAAITGSVDRFVNRQLRSLEAGAAIGRASKASRVPRPVGLCPATA